MSTRKALNLILAIFYKSHIMNKCLLLIAFIVFNGTSCFAKSQPTFSLVATTPTSIVVPENRHTYVQYKVTNNTGVTRTLTMQPIPNVTQVTKDSSQCSNPFTLSRNQSCYLTLYIDGAVLDSNYSGGPVVCKANSNNTPNPFLCSQPEQSMTLYIYPTPAIQLTTKKLYVSNWNGGSISLCSITDAGTIAHCLVSAVSGTFLNPEALTINGNYLFVANIGGGISSCAIDSQTGELTACNNAINDTLLPPVYGPDGIAIQSNVAYIANSGLDDLTKQGVTTCDVNNQNLTNCAFTKGGGDFSVPSDLALFNNTVYITNFINNNQIYPATYNTLATYCTNIPGPLSCNALDLEAGSNYLLNEPEGLFITTLNNSVNTFAYFTNHGNNTVTFCTVASPTSFTDCANTEGYFTGFGNLTILNTPGSPLKAYIPSGLKTIAVCDVNSTTGALSDCVDSTELGFNSPSGLVIKY
jgi:hypothetical protein